MASTGFYSGFPAGPRCFANDVRRWTMHHLRHCELRKRAAHLSQHASKQSKQTSSYGHLLTSSSPVLCYLTCLTINANSLGLNETNGPLTSVLESPPCRPRILSVVSGLNVGTGNTVPASPHSHIDRIPSPHRRPSASHLTPDPRPGINNTIRI